MTMDKHTTWLAYIWALISGICAQWTLNDYGALIGIVLGIGTFLVNKHYKKKAEQAQARQAAAMLALIAAGASAPQLLDQFLQEREGNTLVAVRDNGGVWSVCRGVTRIDGKPVVKGQRLTQSQCDHYNAIERDKALAWVNKHVHIPLTEPQKAGIASFCPYNIGPGKCFPSTFYRKLNAGDRKGACAEIRRWVYDGGKDCHNRENQCYGQVIRRDQESALTCWGINQ